MSSAKQNLARPLLATALLASAPGLVQAGRPLATEDAKVLPASDCEWEAGTGYLTGGGDPATRTASTQLSCGLGWRSQLALGYAQASSSADRLGALTLSGKTALVDPEPQGTGLTLVWALAATSRAGSGYSHDATSISLVASREFVEGLSGYANVGWLRNLAQGRSSTTWNLAAAYTLNEAIELTAEVYGTSRVRAIAGLGARWSVTEKLTLDAAYSVQADSSGLRFFTLGFTLGF